MTQIIGSECDHSDLLHWKTGGFLSLQITFAQGHLQAHMQEFYILLDFGRKRSQQHIVIHSSSLQGCSVYLFFFSGSCFHLEEHWARISLRLTRLLAEACSPFVKHVFHCGPRLSLRVLFLGRLPVGACCHAELQDLKHCNLAVFASLNAKQRGVDQCWLQCSRAPWWKGLHTTTSQLTKQECWAGSKDWGRGCVWI